VLGQTLLARRMGRRRIIAETGAGSTGRDRDACALFDLPCVVYMGATDIERQKPNVFRMKLLGAEVIRCIRDRDLEGRDERGAARLGRPCRGHVLRHRLGRRAASLPRDGARFPIGHRRGDASAARQGGRPAPDTLVACIGGGSNAMGLFHPFLDEPGVAMIGVEAAGTASTPDCTRPH